MKRKISLMNLVLKYSNIKKKFGEKKVLDIKELVFDEGVYGLKGINGSGKSTLCKIIAKVDKPDEKMIYPNIDVGYMPQVSFVFDMTVYDNVLLNISNKNDDNIKKCNKYFDRFKLTSLKYKNAKILSGGEKQKLCLIRLLMKKYDLLVLDEPTSSMDKESMIIAEEEIVRYSKENNCVVLMVSHEEGELERMTNKILYLENGNIAYR